MLKAARNASHPKRDEAILMFLLDTGVRASELCTLKMKDVDLYERRAQVLGKGNKRRTLCFGNRCARILRAYLRNEYRTPDFPLFTSERTEEPLTASGLLQLVHRLRERTEIKVTHCSLHTFRHTFAIDFLRAGGNVFTLQQLMGHTSLQITQRYVSLAQADIQKSVGDSLPLAATVDAYTRRCAGWCVRDHMETALVKGATKMAFGAGTSLETARIATDN